MRLIQNIECGNVFDYTADGIREVLAEAKELYDWGDDTNIIPLSAYYTIIIVQ